MIILYITDMSRRSVLVKANHKVLLNLADLVIFSFLTDAYNYCTIFVRHGIMAHIPLTTIATELKQWNFINQ